MLSTHCVFAFLSLLSYPPLSSYYAGPPLGSHPPGSYPALARLHRGGWRSMRTGTNLVPFLTQPPGALGTREAEPSRFSNLLLLCHPICRVCGRRLGRLPPSGREDPQVKGSE